MLYRGISIARLHLDSTELFNGWLIEYGAMSIPDNRPWFSTNTFFKLNNL